MHTSNTFLNAYLNSRTPPLTKAILIHSITPAFEQWVGARRTAACKRIEYAGMTKLARPALMQEIIQCWEKTSQQLRDLLVDYCSLDLAGDEAYAMLHYLIRRKTLFKTIDRIEGWDIADRYRPYSAYGLDPKLTETCGHLISPYTSIIVSKRSKLRYGIERSSEESWFLRLEETEPPAIGTFTSVLKRLQHYTSVVDSEARKPEAVIADKHYYPSRELMELIFIDDNYNNNVSLGLMAFLRWTLTERWDCDVMTWLQRLRGAMLVQPHSVAWLSSIASMTCRPVSESTGEAGETDDAVVLLDRMLISYVKLAVFETLKKNKRIKLLPYKYSILRLMLLSSSLSYKNLLLAISKRRHGGNRADLYSLATNAIVVHTQLGGTVAEVRDQIERQYPTSLANSDDLYLRNGYVEAGNKSLSFDELCHNTTLDDDPNHVIFPYEALKNQAEFELEDSFSDLLQTLDTVDLDILRHALVSFSEILHVEMSPMSSSVDIAEAIESISAVELRDIKHRLLFDFLKICGEPLELVQKLPPSFRVASLLTGKPAFLHLNVDEQTAVYSFSNGNLATIGFSIDVDCVI